ncbi:hypothetical protein BDV93DRAFT_592672 [Ceratobasidium sp. AG-I]|nr:hypothetical protein BDV93DRAFT_592672 [Ceratobasidium sp. AG-I]
MATGLKHIRFLTVLFGAFQDIIALDSAAFATKLKLEWLVLLILTIYPIADASTLYVLGREPELRNRLLECYYAFSFYTGIQPILYSWITQNKAGHTKTTCTTSLSHCRSYQPKDFVECTRQLMRLSITEG